MDFGCLESSSYDTFSKPLWIIWEPFSLTLRPGKGSLLALEGTGKGLGIPILRNAGFWRLHWFGKGLGLRDFGSLTFKL